MIRINQLKMPLGHDRAGLLEKAARVLRVPSGEIEKLTIVKQSVDARKKPDIWYSYVVDIGIRQAGLQKEEKLVRRLKDRNVAVHKEAPYRLPEPGTECMAGRPVIIGTGPAGLFCGLMLARKGYMPILLERGEDVDARTDRVARFWETGQLDPSSNVQFGEGGAGTFSDGKLNTLVKDTFGRNREVLRILTEFGGDPSIPVSYTHLDVYKRQVIDMNPRTSRKKNRKQKPADFVIQGSILAMAGIVVRIIGMLYRMPLNDIIGKQGNGYYTSAFNVYNILLILSSYSMPVAVSKMISARLARGEHRNCSRILKAALIYATAVGGIAAVVLWFGADLFAELIKTPFSRYALKTLAPTIWIMAYLGVLRGYFQGTGTMVPTAVSQILEQIVNAVVSVVAAGVLFGVGTSINAAQGARDYSYALGAAGGTIGTGAGALTAFLFFICLTASKGRERRQMVREDVSGRTESYRRIFYVLTITVLPIVISSGIYNCSNVVDNYLFGQGMDKLGYLEDSIATYWGVLGQYQLLFNIPVAVSNALSSSLIPSLTRAVANRNRREKLERIATSIRFSLLIAIPAAVGITVLAKPVCNLLFISEDNTMLIRLSMAGSLAVVFYSLSTVTNAILQGLNHMDVPIRHAVIALVIHVAALEVFLMVFKMEIYSVVLDVYKRQQLS